MIFVPGEGYDPPMPPFRLALLAQILGAIAALAVVRVLNLKPFPPLLMMACLQGGLAALISRLFGGKPWWLLIHLLFLPLAVLATRIPVAPHWWLLGFFFLLAVFWRTDRSRVPLYLSNRATATALAGLIPATPSRVLDLGCGTGSLLVRLARLRPDCQYTGIEHAPLPWLIARLRTAPLPQVTIVYGDFWPHPLGDYQLIYAFLSPVPMPRLEQDACARMGNDALLVSNSFPCPNLAAESCLDVKDRRQTRLYCYRPGRLRQRLEHN